MDIRELDQSDDLDELFDLRIRAFGPVTALQRTQWLAAASDAIAAHRYLAVFEGTRLAAAARFHDMSQWWLGRSLAMAGGQKTPVTGH